MKQVNDNHSLAKIVRVVMTALLAGLFLPMVSNSVLAQDGGDYELSWSTIDGGGGTSSGGAYVLTGTIGQPDAAWSSGGNYELLGGFWPGGPICIVEFDDFARFAELWLVAGGDLPADLYKDVDNVVNLLDLKVFVDYWLCYCPPGWPLK